MTEEEPIRKKTERKKTSNLKLYMLVTLFVVIIVTAVIAGTYWFREETPTEELSCEIELTVFSAEGCSACTDAIEIVKGIAESSEMIEYRIIKYGVESEEFEKFGVDFNMVPVTIVLIGGEVRGILGGAYNLDTKIIDIIEKHTSLIITPLPQTTTPVPTTSTTTSPPTTTPAPTEIIKYTNEDADISFEYPSYLTHGTSTNEYTLVVLQNEDVWMDIIWIEASDYTVEKYNDYVIDSLCRDYPPCELMQRVKTHLGEEIGERIIVQYTQNGVKKVRFSLSTDHKGYRYDVRLFTTLSKFDEYMEDAKKIMESFEFLNNAPEIEEGIKTIKIGDITSYYTYSNLEKGSKTEIPAIISIGHPYGDPINRLQYFEGKFDEPVLLISSGLLSDLKDKSVAVENEEIWNEKSKKFLELVEFYKNFFDIDENRIYLTGFSFDGVYAWMLAYDHPELYAGVVAMSSVSYPPQIQNNLDSASEVVTVVVRGERDRHFPQRLEQEKETGRIIESKNPNSMWILKEGETHTDVEKYWIDYLKYILQFKK